MVPVLGILIFIPVLLAAFGIDFGGLGISGLTYPANLAPWAVIVWLVLGVLLFIYLAMRAPERIQATAETFLEG